MGGHMNKLGLWIVVAAMQIAGGAKADPPLMNVQQLLTRVTVLWARRGLFIVLPISLAWVA